MKSEQRLPGTFQKKTNESKAGYFGWSKSFGKTPSKVSHLNSSPRTGARAGGPRTPSSSTSAVARRRRQTFIHVHQSIVTASNSNQVYCILNNWCMWINAYLCILNILVYLYVF